MNFLVIEGLILPSKWDSNGNVMGISLSTFAEEIFSIEQNTIGNELMSYIREEVEVTGVLKNMNGEQIIEVKKYEIKKVRKSRSRKNLRRSA
ncbi:hypothetical protein ACFLZT_06195 [Thermodesulfobacteriota bacterium]